MTSGNLELLQILVSWAVTLPAVAAIIVLDEHRLRGEKLGRAWPPVSRDAALFGVWLGVPAICIVVHFVRTRRTFWGFFQGLLWLFALLAADIGAQLGTSAFVDWLSP